MAEQRLLQKVDPRHSGSKRTLQVLGPALMAIGGILSLIGFISFAAAFGDPNAGVPSNFFLLFVGLPLLGLGIFLTKVAFLGEIGRYAAGELAPVARDTIAYVRSGDAGQDVTCASCGQENGAASNFCEACGKPLAGAPA